jgi:hypothetical protein
MACRLWRSASLSRLEMVGSPRRKLEFYREAREFLASEDWA